MANTAEAEDVAQEAFVRAYLALDRFDETRPLRPWLLSIAANLARNRRRSIGRYLAALGRWMQKEPPSTVDRINVEARTDARLLWQAVQRLRPHAREIVYLRYFLELSEKEAAATLHIPPGTAKSRLHRALKKLRLVIEKEFPELNEAFDEDKQGQT